jgi:tetratricopeptide (TPR) repeat protein
MTSEFDLSSFVERLRILVRSHRDREALEVIEQLDDKHRHATQVLRLKSVAQAYTGDVRGAYEVLRELVTRDDNTIEDLYWAGQRAAEFGHYEDAETFLELAIKRAKDSGNHYYLECSILLRAYVRIHLRKFALAKEDLDELDEDAEICWSDRLEVITKNRLVRQLSKEN